MKYKIGDEVWCPAPDHREILVTCPICLGKRVVHLTLGDGRVVELPCDFCSHGYNNPIGQIVEYTSEPAAELKTICKIEYSKEPTIYYMTSHQFYNSTKVFDTEAEAFAASVNETKIRNEENFELSLHRKHGAETRCSYSWGAGYHLREAKENERLRIWHEELAKVCKERSKV